MRAGAWFTLLALSCSASGTDAASEPDVADTSRFLALVDSEDEGTTVDDEVAQHVRLSELVDQGRETRLVMWMAAAGWCEPCQAEASAVGPFADDYGSRGVLIVTALLEDARGRPADLPFARLWAREFGLTVPVLIDSELVTARYVDTAAMPVGVVLDARTLEVLHASVGADAGGDPLGRYRDILDRELAEP